MQVYAEWHDTSMRGTPIRQLVAFDRFVIKAGQAISAHFVVKQEQLAVWDERQQAFAPPKGNVLAYAENV